MFRYYYHMFSIFLFQLITIVNSYTLLKRYQHTASYANNKVYFIGGATDVLKYTNDFFYLDVSKPFTLDSDLPVVGLNNDLIPKHVLAATTICSSNRDTIFLFGGEFEDAKAPLVFAYNTSNPVLSGSVRR